MGLMRPPQQSGRERRIQQDGRVSLCSFIAICPFAARTGVFDTAKQSDIDDDLCLRTAVHRNLSCL